MNWLTLLMRSLQLLPIVVAGIQHIHGEAPGATKKQMAIDALGLAAGSADVLDPQCQPAVDAAAQLVSKTIDGIVDVYKKGGVFKSGGVATAAAPAAKPAAVPDGAPAPVPCVPIAAPRAD